MVIEGAPQREPHISAKSAVETANLYSDFTVGLMNEMRSDRELARWVDRLRATSRHGSNRAVLNEMRTVFDEGFVDHMNLVVLYSRGRAGVAEAARGVSAAPRAGFPIDGNRSDHGNSL